MLNAAAESEEQFLKSQIGKTVPVLFETSENGKSEGYTPNYSRVSVECDNAPLGQIRNVKIISAENGICSGILV